MKNTKHTPGPWNKEEEGSFVYALNNNNENIFYLSVQAGWGDRIKKVAIRTSNEELNANAQLIAAAPELLEALKEVVDGRDCYCNNTHTNGHVCDICGAHKAIAKAEGN